MEVRTSSAAGSAHQADLLVLGHHLPGADEGARHVAVDGMEAVAMVDLDINPVIAPAGEHHLPGIGGQLGGSVIIRDVDSGVKFPEILRDDAPGRPRESDEMLAAYRGTWRGPSGVGGRCGSCDVLRPHGGNE